jgi:hypothetical protein
MRAFWVPVAAGATPVVEPTAVTLGGAAIGSSFSDVDPPADGQPWRLALDPAKIDLSEIADLWLLVELRGQLALAPV